METKVVVRDSSMLRVQDPAPEIYIEPADKEANQDSEEESSSVSSSENMDNVADGPLDVIKLRQGLKR